MTRNTKIPMAASSGNVANAAAIATLSSDPALLSHICGFVVTAAGATAGLPVIVTITGLAAGTLSFIFAFPAGVLVAATPLVVIFPEPLPASGYDVDIVVTVPAGGAGNTHSSVNAHGFRQTP
jgi:hypothetical protein